MVRKLKWKLVKEVNLINLLLEFIQDLKVIITEEDMIEIFIIEEEKEVDLEVEVMIGIIGIIDILEEIQEVEVEVGVEVLIEGEGNFFFRFK